MDAWSKLGWATLGILFLLKLIGALIRKQNRWTLTSGVLFLFFWPGVDPLPFLNGRRPCEETGNAFSGGLWRFLIGAFAIVGIALAMPILGPNITGWLGIFAILICIHMGLCVIVPIFYRLAGWDVSELFDRPWAARRLIDFWSKHWNLAYVEMNRFLFYPIFRRLCGRRAAIFLLLIASGVLHELALSFPAGDGWGLPFAYFAIQAAGVWIERRWQLKSRIFAYGFFLIPLPILFHAPFRQTCVEPLFANLRSAILAVPAATWIDMGIFTLCILQLSVLAASLQVPARLRWKEELPRLSRLNERLVWTYGLFIAFTILAFGVLVFALHDELAQGDRAAACFALFAACFWTLRLLIDRFWMKAEDWPSGAEMKIGHALLNALFVALAVGYSALAFHGLA